MFKVNQLQPIQYVANDLAVSYGYSNTTVQIGLSAQSVQYQVPEAVDLAPFDTFYDGDTKSSVSGHNYLTVKYERLVPLLVAAIQELSTKIDELEKLKNSS